MEVSFFPNQRTNFIRNYYEIAGAPFADIVHKIEAGDKPFAPLNSEEGEPAYLGEWSQANDGLQILGQTCVSMLSESLRLYFQSWERELGISCKKHFGNDFRDGFIAGFRKCFGEGLGVDWARCPADLAILEQITLARNRAQHTQDIFTIHTAHDRKTLAKYPSPFFIRENERELIDRGDSAFTWTNPTLHTSRNNVFYAIGQVEILGEWLDEVLFAVKYPRKHQ